MVIQLIPLACIIGGTFFGSCIVAIACIELKNIIQGILRKAFNRMRIVKNRYKNLN